MVGGDDNNTNLWMSDREGKLWRQSVNLPYGDGKTSYGATLVKKDDKVGFIFRDIFIYTCESRNTVSVAFDAERAKHINLLQVYLTGGHTDSSKRDLHITVQDVKWR